MGLFLLFRNKKNGECVTGDEQDEKKKRIERNKIIGETKKCGQEKITRTTPTNLTARHDID